MAPQSRTGWSAPLRLPNVNPAAVEMLAAALHAGEAEVDGATARLTAVVGQNRRWLRPLARRYVERFAGRTRPRLHDVVTFLSRDEALLRVCRERPQQLRHARWLLYEPAMQPVATTAAWNVKPLATVAELGLWLRLSPAELAWFADLKTLLQKTQCSPQRQHYHYRWMIKRSGALRLIESPKEMMRSVQRKVLREILDHVPAHPAAHGFVKGRSIRSFAAAHVGQRVVLRIDLKDYFPSIRRARVQSIFRTLGYPEAVADLLGGMCTNAAPRAVAASTPVDRRREAWELYGPMHLPQGAPTSPSLANICSYRLDCRLAGLAQAAGAMYTRYADDLAFSGPAHFQRAWERFAAHVSAIAGEEGFAVQHRKTRVMKSAVRQQLAGVVVNERVNIPRSEFDRMKAILTNCLRNDPSAENREHRQDFRSHLQGRIAFIGMLHPQRADRLRKLFESINWTR